MAAARGAASTQTGYLFEELFMWHNPGSLQVRTSTCVGAAWQSA
jgi:hypothetical protein